MKKIFLIFIMFFLCLSFVNAIEPAIWFESGTEPNDAILNQNFIFIDWDYNLTDGYHNVIVMLWKDEHVGEPDIELPIWDLNVKNYTFESLDFAQYFYRLELMQTDGNWSSTGVPRIINLFSAIEPAIWFESGTEPNDAILNQNFIFIDWDYNLSYGYHNVIVMLWKDEHVGEPDIEAPIWDSNVKNYTFESLDSAQYFYRLELMQTDGNWSSTGVPRIINLYSIQSLINSASSGDTIYIDDGEYIISSAINVNKSITIIGNVTNPENVVIKYEPSNNSLNCIEINSPNVVVKGFKVQDCKNGFHFDRNVNTNINVTISDNIIENVSGWGIGEISSPNTIINNNIITNIGDKGIYFRLCEGTSELNRCEAINNIISECMQSAIQTYYGKYLYIYNNNISSTNDKGINIIESNSISVNDRIQIINNVISGCGYSAIQTSGGKYTYIYNNIISSMNDKGINIIQSDSVGISDRIQVVSNVISETKWTGIQIIGSPYTYVYNNNLTKCNYYGSDGTGDWDYSSIHIQDDGFISSGYVVIDNNIISDGINGIQTWSDNVTIINNEIYNMGLTYADNKSVGERLYKNSGILIGSNWGSGDIDPVNILIQNNSIYNNYWGLFYSSDLVNGVNAKYNYWGSAEPNFDLIVSENVDYIPFYTTSDFDVLDWGVPPITGELVYDFNVENKIMALITIMLIFGIVVFIYEKMFKGK